MNPIQRNLLVGLLVAISAGGLLGCDDKEPEDDSGTHTGGTTTDTREDIQASDYPQCDGETTTSSGPCCVDIYCTEAYGTECPDAADAEAGTVTGLSLGSGSCECAPVAGPYDVVGDPAATGCCYTVGVQGCEGRPLRVAGIARMATVAQRADWARA